MLAVATIYRRDIGVGPLWDILKGPPLTFGYGSFEIEDRNCR